jgi:tape measure domain-containing protein
MSSITFSASLDDSKLQAGIKRSNQTIGAWAKEVEKDTSSVDANMRRLGAAIATYFTGRELIALGKEIINVRGTFQQLTIAFETMLDSKDKADKLMRESIDLAQKTPFTLIDITTNVKQLMAMGIATENVMDTMKALGDVAAGVSVPISRVAINYGQVAVLGKLQAREVRDFAMAGIPLTEELAKNMGKTKDEIADMVTAGQIGFPLVEAAFKSMAGEGGKFYNLMEKQNASVTGQISNLTDKWQVMLNEIGKSNEGLIYGGISGLSGLIANYETVLDILKGLVVVLGAVKVATMIVAREQKIQAAVTLLVAESNDFFVRSEARAIVMKQRSMAAQQKLNASMLTNPYVLVTAAVAALGYGLYKLITYQTDLEKAIEKTDIEIENEKDKALDLFAALKSTTTGTEEWSKARQNIIDQYGQYLPDQLQELNNLINIKEAQDLVNQSLVENAALKIRGETLQDISAEYNTEIVKAQADIVNKIEKELGKERAAAVKYELAQLIAEYKAGIPGAEKELAAFRTKLMGEVGNINAEGFATNIAAANISGVFSPLFSALKTAQIETDLANKAFEDYVSTLTKPVTETPPAEEVLITAAQQRLEIKKQLIEAEQKLKDLETTPGINPLQAIEDQRAVIKALQDQLGAEEQILSIEEEIDKQTELLRQAIERKNEKEINDISTKINLLEQELYLQEQLMEKALGAAIVRETPVAQIATSAISPTFGSKISNTLIPARKELFVADEEYNKRMEESAQKQLDLRIQITNASADLVYQLGAQLGMDQESMEVLNAGLNTITSLASGNYIGAAVSLLSGLISSIPSQAEKFAAQIAEINALIQEQQRLLQLSARTGSGDEARAKVLQDMNAKLSAQMDELERKEKNNKIWNFILGDTGSKKRTGDIEELNAAIKETQDAIAAAELELQDFLGGGVTQNTIADAIARGFQEGKTSVDDFASYMNDILIDSVLNVFKAEILGPAIDEATKYISSALSDNVLTPEEKANIDNMVAQAANNSQQLWDDLTGALNLGGTTNTGLSGQIARSITEETGTELAGLFRRFADEQRVAKDYTVMGVNHLVGIEKNTFDTVAELQKTNIKLDTVISNTNTKYAGDIK